MTQVERLKDPNHIPEWMNGEGEVAARLRKTYSRIRDAARGNILLAAEKEQALAWCRENGNPHTAPISITEGGE